MTWLNQNMESISAKKILCVFFFAGTGEQLAPGGDVKTDRANACQEKQSMNLRVSDKLCSHSEPGT